VLPAVEVEPAEPVVAPAPVAPEPVAPEPAESSLELLLHAASAAASANVEAVNQAPWNFMRTIGAIAVPAATVLEYPTGDASYANLV